MENSTEFLKKLKVELPHDAAISLLGLYQRKLKFEKTYEPQCSSIYNCQDMEAIYMSIYKQMDKEDMVHI